jgi:hypothetical protein
MTYVKALSSTSWVVAYGNIIQRSVSSRVQERVEEAKRGFAGTNACVIQHGNERGERGCRTRCAANGQLLTLVDDNKVHPLG